MNTKLEGKIAGGRGGCYKFRDAVVDFYVQGIGFINGVQPRVGVEPSPHMRPVINHGGKVRARLEAMDIEELKPEWETKLAIDRSPSGQRPNVLALGQPPLSS